MRSGSIVFSFVRASLAVICLLHPAVAQKRQGNDDNLAARALLGKARLEYAAGNTTKAAEYLLTAAKSTPGDFDIRFLLGAILVEQDQRDAALTHLEAANRLRPDDPDAAKMLALEYHRLNRARDAVRVLQPFLDPERRDEEAYLLALQAYHQAGDQQRSRLSAETALKIFPDSGRIVGWMGFQHASAGELAQAKKLLQRAIQLEPGDHAAYYVLGDVLLKEQQYAEAVRYLRLGIERKPDHGEARARLARALFELGQTKEAIAQLEQARDLLPEDPTIRLELSQLYFRLGDNARARAESGEFQRLKKKAEESGSTRR